MVSKMEMLSKMDRNNSIERKTKEMITTKKCLELFKTVAEALVLEVVKLGKVQGGAGALPLVEAVVREAEVTEGVVAVGVGEPLEVGCQADAEAAEGAVGNLGAGDGGRDGAGIGHQGSRQGQVGRCGGLVTGTKFTVIHRRRRLVTD